MNIPKLLQDKPLTEDLVQGMSSIGALPRRSDATAVHDGPQGDGRGQRDAAADNRYASRRGHLGTGIPSRERDRFSISRF